MRFYVHGAGRAGRDAWPQQPSDGGVFGDHRAATAVTDKAALVAAQAPAPPFVLVAHSLGAPVAVLAMRDRGLAPSHLVLAEPALYDVARGHVSIEAHIAPMSRALALASDGDLFAYWRIVKPLMFGAEAEPEAWAEDRERAARLAALEPPWGHGFRAEDVVVLPTLVVTGAWNPEYEAIAEHLVEKGARHVVLAGSGHRVQDHPEFNELVSAFARGAA